MKESARLSKNGVTMVWVFITRISATDPPLVNAASRCLDGRSEQAVLCECLHMIAVAEFTK